MRSRSVSVRVPATTANLGPGFDCLGMALDWWNDVHVELSSTPHVRAIGEGADTLSNSEGNLVYRAAQALFLARGLGSSAAALVGGLVAANALCERPLDESCLLQLAARMEGHADNVAPALLGGCRIVVRNGDSIVADEVPTSPEIKAIVLVPEVPMPTRQARAVLPSEVTREDAVFNIGRVALLVNALAQGRGENLRVATQDRLHQPARAAIFPAMKYVIRAAESAGALCAFLSGGGSSVLALAASRFMTIGFEMADAADKLGFQASIRITTPSALGAHVVSRN